MIKKYVRIFYRWQEGSSLSLSLSFSCMMETVRQSKQRGVFATHSCEEAMESTMNEQYAPRARKSAQNIYINNDLDETN